MVVFPDNYIAICGKSEFEKAKNKLDYGFKLNRIEKINNLEGIEALIESI